ncbi:FAD-dependent oxidoreductase [Ancylobacter sp. G4_0304]|uniref:FAD-dependent oxidoreductase n=1 Tax=Ancylobacter sp. G4_0304 TaxID=3114289 RepID=UPI0039C6FF5F
MARIAVVGAGIVGVASAYLLCKAGHDVTLVDRHSGPAQGASRANGAQLSYAYGDALATPSMLGHLPAIVLGRDPAYRVRLNTDPEFLVWGLRFLGNCLPGRFLANTQHLLQMAARTSLLLKDLLDEFDLPFDYTVAGKMILYPSIAACEKSAAVQALKRSLGLQQDILTRSEATAIEPALDLYPDEIGRVLYNADDAAGRPDAFAAALIERLKEAYGLRTVFGHPVQSILDSGGSIRGLAFASREPLECDLVVVASGSPPDFLPWRDRGFGSVWPVQGYSITARATPAAMRTSLTDVRRKIVFARIGDEVRAAGLADIGPRDFRFDGARFDTFRTAATTAFGGAFEQEANGAGLQPWSGARPCAPSSRPIIRQGSLNGLYLNLGHGTLGWTLSLGSASRLVDIIQPATSFASVSKNQRECRNPEIHDPAANPSCAQSVSAPKP